MPKPIIKLTVLEEHLGFRLEVNGIASDLMVINNVLSMIRSIWYRFHEKYAIHLKEELTFELTQGELDYAFGRQDSLVIY